MKRLCLVAVGVPFLLSAGSWGCSTTDNSSQEEESDSQQSQAGSDEGESDDGNTPQDSQDSGKPADDDDDDSQSTGDDDDDSSESETGQPPETSDESDDSDETGESSDSDDDDDDDNDDDDDDDNDDDESESSDTGPVDDEDDDNVDDSEDNCPDIPNPDQEDSDGDGKGDACDCELTAAKCENGKADGYPCQGYELVGHMSRNQLGLNAGLNDSWGWTDPENGWEYALVGTQKGVAFVDMHHPYCPRLVGTLPNVDTKSVWRDIKVWENTAYVVSEEKKGGIQVFDLTRLRGVKDPETFKEDKFMPIGNSHNVVVNQHAPTMAVVLSSACSGGLSLYDLSDDPGNPKKAGCWSEAKIHDAHCIVYDGPDMEYKGKQLCVTSNDRGKSMSIVNIDNLQSPSTISTTRYDGSYSHQGWMSEDHKYYFHGDELDEGNKKHNTRTYMWDISDLDKPKSLGYFEHSTKATDHNMYTNNGLLYQANYRAGLRVLNTDKVAEGKLEQVGYFDTYPQDDGSSMSSAWNTYPFFKSGYIIISAMSEGLFIVKPEKENPDGN